MKTESWFNNFQSINHVRMPGPTLNLKTKKTQTNCLKKQIFREECRNKMEIHLEKYYVVYLSNADGVIKIININHFNFIAIY